MATFVMQSLGCDVSAINTVHYSNHTAYKSVKGTKTSAQQIQDLYDGLQQANVNNFDLLLTGYMPSAEAVQEIGKIGRNLKYNAVTRPGSFFWVLDPVMGDNGKLYIPEDEVQEYKSLLREADLILPNQFEAELLSDTTITDLTSLAKAIQVLHKTYQVPHVIITSLRLTADNQTVPSKAQSRAASKQTSARGTPSRSPVRNPETSHPSSWSGLDASPPSSTQNAVHEEPWTSPLATTAATAAAAAANDDDEEEDPTTLTIIGSTSTSSHEPRLWRIDTPQLPLFFSGTGDMFAALTIPRLIEAVRASPTPNLHSTPSWKSPDDVQPEDLPLAKAAQKVLASMQAILGRTAEKCGSVMRAYDQRAEKEGLGSGDEDRVERERRRHLVLMDACEVVVPRFVKELLALGSEERAA
ncbi:Ribokinase-like protein [Amniculicola lignicola CBS 123094]|uniref:pyridoxal kinase n=1 Tax=Amniculicola lignicola CBS 123094 TaxID=1392246 RepID=A0A6A5WP51_9PLEO|nr:Ribokinase-like protein [Amniculicola lignicola CBS 123094]